MSCPAAGGLQLRTIPSADLRRSDLPAPDAPRIDVENFALAFNGYEFCGGFAQCAALANDGTPSTLDEWRAVLFFEQRRARHSAPFLDDGAMREALERVRELVPADPQTI